MMKALELIDLSVAIGDRTIVEALDMELESGQIGCLLGPSGCGKTTLLRGIAGFETTTRGEVRLEGICVSRPGYAMPVEARQVGMVFQDFALFPHLSVRDNIGFGLSATAMGSSARRMRERAKQRVEEVASLLDILALLDEYPHRLSGGQQQRVAVARAIAPRPHILLLDEPFASLDVELRESIARDIRKVLKEEGITTILVTHNQFEAFAMADEIGVMRNGRLLQWDTASNLYHRPVSPSVADFVGEGRFIPGKAIDQRRIQTELGIASARQPHNAAPDSPVSVLVRPDDVQCDIGETSVVSRVVERAFRGASYLYTLELPSGHHVLCLAAGHQDYEIGEQVGLALVVDGLIAFAQE